MSKIWMAIKQVERERELVIGRQRESLQTTRSLEGPVALSSTSWTARLGAVLAARRRTTRTEGD